MTLICGYYLEIYNNYILESLCSIVLSLAIALLGPVTGLQGGQLRVALAILNLILLSG